MVRLPDLPLAQALRDSGTVPALLATLLLAGLLLAIARADLRTLRIPDVLNFALIGTGLALSLAGPQPPSHLLGALAGFGLFWTIGEVHFRRTGREGLGIGDAKLFAGAGAWLGWQGLAPVLLIAALTGLMAALVRRGRGELAFGPWLALGIGVIWVRAVWMN